MAADFIPSFDKKTVLPEKPLPENTIITVMGVFLLLLAGAAAYFLVIKKGEETDTEIPQQEITSSQDTGVYGFSEGEPYTVEKGLEIERSRYEWLQEQEATGKYEVESKSPAEIAAENGQEYVMPEPTISPDDIWQSGESEQYTNQEQSSSPSGSSPTPDNSSDSSLPTYAKVEERGEGYVLPEPTLSPHDFTGTVED